jgi:PAS domain-containing protein
LVQLIVPVVYLGVVLYVDHVVPGATILPALLTMGLLSTAFFLHPACVSASVILYTIVVASGFFSPLLARYLNDHPLAPEGIEYSHYIRTLTFFMVGSFSVLFSVMLRRMRKAHQEIDEIIARFPYPLVISTESGTLSYANKAARQRFGLPEKEVGANDFTRLFAPKSAQEHFAYDYAQRVSSPDCSELGGNRADQPILPLEFEGKTFYGDTVPLLSQGRKKLLTIFLEIDTEG